MATASLHQVTNKSHAPTPATPKPVHAAPRDEFERKLATAKRKHAPVVKAAVVGQTRKQTQKPAAEDAEKPKDGETVSDTVQAKSGDAKSPVKAKKASEAETEAADSKSESVHDQTGQALTPIDPDSKKHESHHEAEQRPKPKAVPAGVKPAAPTAVAQDPSIKTAVTPPVVTEQSLTAPNANESKPAGPDRAAPLPSQDAPASSSPQDVLEQVPPQPTFGSRGGEGQGGAKNQNGESQNTNQAAAATSNVATKGDGSDTAAVSAFASALNDALATAEPAADPHGSPTPVPATDLGGAVVQAPVTLSPQQNKPTAVVASTPQARFVEDNHPRIVTGISGQLLPDGGKMQLQLNPPGLGELQVTVHLNKGSMSAEFEASNDDAARMLSHSLGQLKATLESAGMTVERLHVGQAPKREEHSQGDTDSRSAPQEQQQQARQEKQRRDLMQRMWAKLAGGDPLDLVA